MKKLLSMLVAVVMLFSATGSITFAATQLTDEQIKEYMVYRPTMNVSGGSETQLIDTFEPITIKHPAGNDNIYYTTDGSEPTLESNKYTGPFYICGSAHLQACAIAPDGTKSPISSAWVYNQKWAATAARFRIEGENTVNNIKIAWPLYPNATVYEVYRDGKLIGKTTGDAIDEYNLDINKNYTYTVKAFNGADVLLAQGKTNTVTTFAIDLDDLTGYDDNVNGGWVSLKSGDPQPGGYNINGKYYRVETQGVSREEFVSLGLDGSIWDSTCSCVALRYLESEDGISWPTEWKTIYPVFVDLRIEGNQTGLHYDGETITWSGHAEGTNGYDTAKLFFAAFKPGRDVADVKPYAVTVSGGKILRPDNPWEQYENKENPGGNELSSYYIGRPFGYDSRDMVRFTDGKDMYTFSAVSMNSDMLILKLDDNWTKPEKVMQIALQGQHQESPSVFRYKDKYYIYTSTANGWFASQARYASTTALDEPWSPMRMVANAGTFGTQANGVWGYGSESGGWVQRGHGYNWGQFGGWRDSNYEIFYHMAINDGIATGNWCSKMEYHPYWGAIAVQLGETVSLGKTATINGKEDSRLTDNVQLQRTGVVDVDSLPYNVIIDLEVPTVIKEVCLTNDLYTGSTTGSRFKVYGSSDKITWITLDDQTNRNDDDPAFRVASVTNETPFRYVKVEVTAVSNLQNRNASALWGGKPLEVAVYGKPQNWVAENVEIPQDITVGYEENNIDFTPYGQEPEIINGRTMVPLRAIFETMGATVDWDEETKTVTSVRDNVTISLTIDSDKMYVNGEEVAVDTPAQIINGRTMVPVRVIAESFNCKVNWNDKARRVAITEEE